MMGYIKLFLSLAALATGSLAACPSVLVPSYNLPQLAPGWQAQLIANGFKKPRSIVFDSAGGLLVLDSGVGIKRIELKDNGSTCLSVTSTTLLVNQTTLNHGLALSGDGKTVYASSVQSVFAWSYDPTQGTISGPPTIVITNMSNNDLTTRTLLMSKKKDGMLVVSRGSNANYDVVALDVSTGRSQIRAFDLAKLVPGGKPYEFSSDGIRLGWGLRNSVGVAEEPSQGGIYSVENSIDDMTRAGVDIHENNPGEELNYHGLVTDTNERGNYGYPVCFALWDVTGVPDASELQVGEQFSMVQNSSINDTVCATQFVPPRLTLPAHTAPLGIIFNNDGTEAFISFHGSSDTNRTTGFMVSSLAFAKGQPVALASSTAALSTIMANPDLSQCPDRCFRPVGLAWDTQGRLWMTSDNTGEIYVLQKVSGTPTTTGSGTIVTATGSPSAASVVKTTQAGAVSLIAVFVAALLAF